MRMSKLKIWRTIAIALAVVLVGGGIIALTRGNSGTGGLFGSTATKIDMEKSVDVSGTSRYSNGILTLKTGTANMATVSVKASDAGVYRLDIGMQANAAADVIVSSEVMSGKGVINTYDLDAEKGDRDGYVTVPFYTYLAKGNNKINVASSGATVMINSMKIATIQSAEVMHLGGTMTKAVTVTGDAPSGLDAVTGALYANADKTSADTITTSSFTVPAAGKYSLGLFGNWEGGFKVTVYDEENNQIGFFKVTSDFSDLNRAKLYNEDGKALGWADTGIRVDLPESGSYHITLEPLTGSGHYLNYLGCTLSK